MLCLPEHSWWSYEGSHHSIGTGWNSSRGLHIQRKVCLLARRQQSCFPWFPKAHHIRSKESNSSHLCWKPLDDHWSLYGCCQSLWQCWHGIINLFGCFLENQMLLCPFRPGKCIRINAAMPALGSEREVCAIWLQGPASSSFLCPFICFLQKWSKRARWDW